MAYSGGLLFVLGYLFFLIIWGIPVGCFFFCSLYYEDVLIRKSADEENQIEEV